LTLNSAGGGYRFDLDSKPPCTAHARTAARPFFFSVKLPEGNYNVTVRLGDPDAASLTTR
jgi:hypothetical protein